MSRFSNRMLRAGIVTVITVAVTMAAFAGSVQAGGGGLGAKNPATGTPVKVGFIGDGQSSAIDNRDEIAAAKAGVKYANTYLGGLGGHKIDLITCETRQDPAVAADCGNQMVEEGVVAVLAGVSGQSLSFYEPVHAADIPFFEHTAGDQDILLDKESSFALTNPLAGPVGHPASVVKEEGFDQAAAIVIDVPTATGIFNALGKTIFKNQGATLDVVAVPPGTADMTPQIQAELENDPDLIHIVGDGSFCLSAFQALNDLAYDGVVTAISNCLTEEVIDSLPKGALKGVRLSAFIPVGDKTDATWKLYLDAMKKYAPDADPNSATTAGGFAVTVAFAQAMAGATGDITPASVITTLKAMPPGDLPVGGGITYQCNGQQSSIVPAVCSVAALESTLTASGKAKGWTVFDPSDVLTLG
jgi:branched-chain amino acid transport system substrate-binding protein